MCSRTGPQICFHLKSYNFCELVVKLGQPLLGEKYVTWKEERKKIPKIVDTTFCCNIEGLRTHFARTNLAMAMSFFMAWWDMFDHVYSKDKRFVLWPSILSSSEPGELVKYEMKMGFANEKKFLSMPLKLNT